MSEVTVWLRCRQCSNLQGYVFRGETREPIVGNPVHMECDLCSYGIMEVSNYLEPRDQ